MEGKRSDPRYMAIAEIQCRNLCKLRDGEIDGVVRSVREIEMEAKVKPRRVEYCLQVTSQIYVDEVYAICIAFGLNPNWLCFDMEPVKMNIHPIIQTFQE